MIASCLDLLADQVKNLVAEDDEAVRGVLIPRQGVRPPIPRRAR